MYMYMRTGRPELEIFEVERFLEVLGELEKWHRLRRLAVDYQNSLAALLTGAF